MYQDVFRFEKPVKKGRFLDEQTLKPKVAESGYRYYEFHQAMLVVQCIRLQNMGFTSKEISEILDHTVSADMRQVFEEKREKILQKYHLYREMLCCQEKERVRRRR